MLCSFVRYDGYDPLSHIYIYILTHFCIAKSKNWNIIYINWYHISNNVFYSIYHSITVVDITETEEILNFVRGKMKPI